MAALDTNVVIRLIMGDDAKQARAAQQLLAAEPCKVSLSVLMESEWVLRSCYGLETGTINESFRDFLQLEHVSGYEPLLTKLVIAAHAAGIDFADAVHVMQIPDGEQFATFDRDMVRSAKRAGLACVALVRT